MKNYIIEQTFTPISELGRNELLNKLKQYKGYKHPTLIIDNGDDAAILAPSKDCMSLFSSDSFVEGADFDPTYTPLKHFGYKMNTNILLVFRKIESTRRQQNKRTYTGRRRSA